MRRTKTDRDEVTAAPTTAPETGSLALDPGAAPPRVKLAACRSVIDFASRLATRDLAERVADLEDRLASGDGW